MGWTTVAMTSRSTEILPHPLHVGVHWVHRLRTVSILICSADLHILDWVCFVMWQIHFGVRFCICTEYSIVYFVQNWIYKPYGYPRSSRAHRSQEELESMQSEGLMSRYIHNQYKRAFDSSDSEAISRCCIYLIRPNLGWRKQVHQPRRASSIQVM